MAEATGMMASESTRLAMEAVALRYTKHSRFARGYVRGKFKHDPVYAQLAEFGPHRSPLWDLGCGRGQSAALLNTLQPDLEVFGVDFDPKKVALANAVLGAQRYEVADMAEFECPQASTILMIDVLHYHPWEVQKLIIRRAISSLNRGGMIYLREVDASAAKTSRWNRFQEWLALRLGINRAKTLCFRPIGDYRAIFEEAGMSVEAAHSVKSGLPLVNVLLCAHASPRVRT